MADCYDYSKFELLQSEGGQYFLVCSKEGVWIPLDGRNRQYCEFLLYNAANGNPIQLPENAPAAGEARCI